MICFNSYKGRSREVFSCVDTNRIQNSFMHICFNRYVYMYFVGKWDGIVMKGEKGNEEGRGKEDGNK